MSYLSAQAAELRFAGPLPADAYTPPTATERATEDAHLIAERICPDLMKLLDLLSDLRAEGVVDADDVQRLESAWPAFEDIQSRLANRAAEI